MGYRFKPTEYVIRRNGNVKYRILKLVSLPNKESIYKSKGSPKSINEKVYECISAKGATYFFRDEELEPWK
jgi:hypothetical protein